MWKTHEVCLRALVGIPLKETIEEEVEKKKKAVNMLFTAWSY